MSRHRGQRGAKGGIHARRRPQQSVDQRPFQVQIDTLSHDGRGIVRQFAGGLDQGKRKTLFVEGALAGETVEARLFNERGKFAEAETLAVVEPSAERVSPFCAHYGRCGGCHLQHMDGQAQLRLKQDTVVDQLQRLGGVQPQRLLAPISAADRAYRSRARLGVWYEKDGSVTLGFRRRRQKQLQQIDSCPVLIEPLNCLLASLRESLQGLVSERAVTHIELVAGDCEQAVLVRHVKPLHERDKQSLALLAEQRAVAVWLQPKSGSQLHGLDGTVADPRLSYALPEFDVQYRFHPTDFIQVNAEVNRAMVSQALTLLAPSRTERVLDLFCGIGNFTLPLARRAAEVAGIEAIDAMVERGRENSRYNELDNTLFVAADLEQSFARQSWARPGFDCLLLDPPRAGAKGAIDSIGELAVERLVYVSCNPATLARDAQWLARQGYQLDALGVMDMFPQTEHIESMALFRRR